MYISDFKYHKPKTLEEACKLLEQSKDGAALAGGTDLLVEIKQGRRHHENIISLSGIKELSTISKDKDNLYIGAGATHNEVNASAIIKEKFPAIAEAASKIGTTQIRNTATIGGNLCTGASCCDMAPVLIAINASIKITSRSKARTMLLKDFFSDHRKTSLNKGEIMTMIIVPYPQAYTGVYFKKFGLRNSASISVASTATMVKLNNGVCTDACIVIGAVAPTAKISNKAGELIKGKNISELSGNSPVLEQAGKAAAKDAMPIDDIRGRAKFRRDIIVTLVKRTIIKAVERAKSNS